MTSWEKQLSERTNQLNEKLAPEESLTPPVNPKRFSREWWALLTAPWSLPLLLVLAAVVVFSIGYFTGGAVPALIVWWGKQIPENEQSIVHRAVPQLVTVVAGAVAGGIAWWQWDRSYKHRERELNLRSAELGQRDFQFTQKQAEDAKNAEKKAQQDQFVDIQNRLSSVEAIIRANAALRLGEFAREPIARTPTEKEKEPKLPPSEKNNPYFVPAASQLTTALYLEPRSEIREAVKKALEGMVEFAKVEEGQSLLNVLISQLIDTNKIAKNSYLDAMAEWAVARFPRFLSTLPENQRAAFERTNWGIHPDDLSLLAAITKFCQPQVTVQCLTLLMNEQDSTFGTAFRIFKAKWDGLSDEEKSKVGILHLTRLETTASQLRDTRDALATALKGMKVPTEFETKFSIEGNYDLQEISNLFVLKFDTGGYEKLRGWQREPALSLSRCFLAGANLYCAQLQGTDLTRTHLIGTELSGVQLQGAKLNGTYLQFANLVEAKLQGAFLASADLREADLRGAQMQCVNLKDSNLYGVLIQREKTQNLHVTEFSGSSHDLAIFTPSNDLFRNAEADARTVALQEWLK